MKYHSGSKPTMRIGIAGPPGKSIIHFPPLVIAEYTLPYRSRYNWFRRNSEPEKSTTGISKS